MEVLLVLMGFSLFTLTSSERGKRASQCSLENLDIPHGSFEVRSGSSIIVYTCDDGFILFGENKLYCIASAWTTAPPTCITNTCPDVPVQEPLRVEKEYNGSRLRFSCAVMNILEGPETITCDGTSWNASPPKCTPAAPATMCNFESPTLCGWTHHDDTDVQWRSQKGKTKTSRTGPDHDHTYGATGSGRYMYFETSSPSRTGHKAILLSPLYPRSYSRRCFDFWYHILGEGDVAALQVYIKPETRKLDDLEAIFTVNENKGADWLKHTLLIQYTPEPFQVVFVATRGKSFRSDVALDDVVLYVCPDYFPTTSTKVVTTMKPTVKTTTKATPATTRRMRVTQTSAKLTSTSVKLSTPEKPISTVLSNVTFSTQDIVTVTPLINPNVPVQSSKVADNDDGQSNLIYILVGVGLVVAITVVIGVGIYCCRRKNNRYTMQSNGAVNPLYSAMTNDEAAIHFANAHDLE